jgi:hypothetical protein
MRSAEAEGHGNELGLSQQQLKYRAMTGKRDSIGRHEIKEMMARKGICGGQASNDSKQL